MKRPAILVVLVILVTLVMSVPPRAEESSRVAVQKLVADGPIFRTADGQPWRWKLVSMFTAARRFSEGEDLAAQVAWTKKVGGNGWRVFLQHAFMDWDPPRGVFEKHWITPLDKVRPLADYLARHGLYVEFTILADCQQFGGDGERKVPALNQSFVQQRDRVRDVIAAVGDAPNVILEIANEPPLNGVDTWRIVDALGLQENRRRPVLMSSGDYEVAGRDHNFRVLDFIGNHPGRDSKWSSEAGKTQHRTNQSLGAAAGVPASAGRLVPVPADEPHKFGETAVDGPDQAEVSLESAEDAGGGFGLGSAGATCHTVDGIRSQVPGPRQTDACTKYFAAMDFFPADAVTGDYSHDGLPDHPLAAMKPGLAGEVISRVRGRTRYVVASQTKDGWVAVPKPGCSIARQGGRRNNLLELACSAPRRLRAR